MSELENRVTALETKIEEKFAAHDTSALLRQNLTCDKLDLILGKINGMDDRCFNRTELYVLTKKHLEDERNIKSLWQDRRFKLLLLIIGSFQGIYMLFITWFFKTMFKTPLLIK